MSHQALNEAHEQWTLLIQLLQQVPDKNGRAVYIQQAISELGPAPDDLGPTIRDLLK